MKVKAGQYIVKSETRKGATYTVTVKNNTVACNCPGFRYHKHCKHADAMRAGSYEIAA